MSTIKTTNITHGSNSGTNNIILDDTGKVSIAAKKLHCPGQIIQVVQGKLTTTASFSGTDVWEDTGLSCTITPQYTTSDILVCYRVYLSADGGNWRKTRLARQIASGSFAAVTDAHAMAFSGSSQTTSQSHNIALDWMDDPSFSAGETVTYRVELDSQTSTFYINRTGSGDNDFSSSTITLYEIAK